MNRTSRPVGRHQAYQGKHNGSPRKGEDREEKGLSEEMRAENSPNW